jgi:hypothetical protein
MKIALLLLALCACGDIESPGPDAGLDAPVLGCPDDPALCPPDAAPLRCPEDLTQCLECNAAACDPAVPCLRDGVLSTCEGP